MPADRKPDEAAYKERQTARELQMARTMQDGRDTAGLGSRACDWSFVCPVCYTYKRMGRTGVDAHHSLEECTDPDRSLVTEEKAVLEGLERASGTGCPRCALPLDDCYYCNPGIIHGASP
jgi:hypothetical protein